MQHSPSDQPSRNRISNTAKDITQNFDTPNNSIIEFSNKNIFWVKDKVRKFVCRDKMQKKWGDALHMRKYCIILCSVVYYDTAWSNQPLWQCAGMG